MRRILVTIRVTITAQPTPIATIGSMVLRVSTPVFGSIATPAAMLAEAPSTCPVDPEVDIHLLVN